MKKKDKTWIYVIIGIALFLLILYGGNQGWFNSIKYIQGNQTLSITPKPETTYSSCSQVCSAQGFSKYYDFINSCKVGENKITYGYSNQAPLLTCCCYNEATPVTVTCGNSLPTCGGTCQSGYHCVKKFPPNSGAMCGCIKDVVHTCTDSDGENKDIPGHVIYDGATSYDQCQADGNTVQEFICVNNIQNSKMLSCGAGKYCLQTRSGGECVNLPTWNPGDTVFSGSGSASVIGNSPQISSIDLSKYGLSANGNCRLGVQLQTSWYYSNDKCIGIPGMQGIKWEIFDSNGLRYNRIDSTPISLGVDLFPPNYIWNWDGITPWRASITPYPFPFPECSITYSWEARIYIYDCL